MCVLLAKLFILIVSFFKFVAKPPFFLSFFLSFPFLTRELRACARASYRYHVGNGIRSLARSLDWSIPVNFFLDFRLLSAFDSF